MRVAIDTGGTFTDCVYLADGRICVLKVASTPADPSQAVLGALQQIAASLPASEKRIDVRLGTTVGTNTLLERTGALVAMVTTAGFEDVIAIGRQTRPKLYDWFASAPVCLVDSKLRIGIEERVSAEGKILRSPSENELLALVSKVGACRAEAIAICLLFSFTAPETELRVEAALRSLDLPISVSHRILPEFREYERASTTVVNAYLAPRMGRYLLRLEESVAARHGGGIVDVMQSSGGIISARLAAREPVRTVLSGPAGGVIGACETAQMAGFHRVIGFDMGGTSTDVFLSNAASGGVRITSESLVAGMPTSVPMLDIHTAGAGGGSIARFDAGGMLRVGPESAGANPGPICFGDGMAATVTDANLLLGRLDAESFLEGRVQLDRARAERLMLEQKGVLPTVESFAQGIIRVVEANMEKAIRVISTEQGHDPREFCLVAFGGGGPLHACALASALRIPTVLIPENPGALSAVGILLADGLRDYSLTVMLPGEAVGLLDFHFATLEERNKDELELGSGSSRCVREQSLDLRYRGQGHELNVRFDPRTPEGSIDAFHDLHQKLYGFSDSSKPIEIVNIRLRVIVAGPAYSPMYDNPVDRTLKPVSFVTRHVYFADRAITTPFYRRDELTPGVQIYGPAIIAEYTSATVLPPGCRAVVDGYRNIVISVAEGLA